MNQTNRDMHSKSILFLLLTFFIWNDLAHGQEKWGVFKTVLETVNIRERRSIESKIVGKLYPGETVKTDFTRKNWTAVFLVDETICDESRVLGYVYTPLLKPPKDLRISDSADPSETPDNSEFTLSDKYCMLETDFDLPKLKKMLPQLSRISEPHTEDLPGMLNRRTIRVLTTYSLPNYFISQGRSFGFEYSLLKDYERFLNQGKRKRELGITVEFFPVPQDQLVPSLVAGLGDIVAAGLSVSLKQPDRIEFTAPYLNGIREVFVSHKDFREIKSLGDLAGRQIYVRPVGSYHETLRRLNVRLAALDLPPLKIIKADTFSKPIDVLEMLNAGIVELSIIENHLCNLWTGIFPNLRFYDPLSHEAEREVAWIVRKGNSQLKASLNRFISDHKKGTLHGNIYFSRYFKNVQWIKNPLSADDRTRFSRYTPLFKKYGARYGFDWMLIAAVAYQESGLDPLRRSPAGAVGMMQVMPSTAKSRRIGIDNPHWLENNVHAGAKYLALLRDTYFSDPSISSRERIYFVLAAYNAGPGKIRQARGLAHTMGYNPNQWFHHTEMGVLKLIGQETVRYVSNVNKYYLAYSLSSTLDCLKNRNLIFKQSSGPGGS